MSLIKFLNNLLLMGNLLGIYRNYYSQTKTKKFFIVVHIFIQTILQIIIVTGQLYILLLGDVFNQINYIYSYFAASSNLTSLVSVLTGIWYSRAFITYIKSISHVSDRFKDDMKLNNSLKKLYWFSITFIIISIAFAVLRTLDIILNFTQVDYDVYVLAFVPVFLSQTFVRITIFFQNLILFVVIMIVVNLSQCLNSLILAVQQSVGNCDIDSDEQCDITREQIQGWVELYRDLANCCENVTLCFGFQFSSSLVMTVSFFILLTYQMCYLSVLNIQDQKIVIVILIYILLLMLTIVAGQLAHNQGVKFHRVLTRLYNTMIIFDSNEDELKLIKDFIRLIQKNPLEIKLLSKIPIGTYILPVILMSTVNYIIVMLQFNNIV